MSDEPTMATLTAELEVLRAEKHRWNEHRIKYIREMRAGLAPITTPQQPKEPTT